MNYKNQEYLYDKVSKIPIIKPRCCKYCNSTSYHYEIRKCGKGGEQVRAYCQYGSSYNGEVMKEEKRQFVYKFYKKFGFIPKLTDAIPPERR